MRLGNTPAIAFADLTCCRLAVGADLSLKRAYFLYQFFVCLLKFVAFFVIGFSIQMLVLVSGVPTVEFVLTIAALPIILVFLLASAVSLALSQQRQGTY